MNHSLHHLPRTHNHINGNSTTQACAACKYQRRKCAPDCILAPYFPHDRQQQFLNAHKLFGVSNITKIIKNLDPYEKLEAMNTIIYQSDARARDPVGGCHRIIRDLHSQLEFCKRELNIVLQQLAICKAQRGVQQQHHHHVINGSEGVLVDIDADPMSAYAGTGMLQQQYQFMQPYEEEGAAAGTFVGQFESNEERENLEEEVGMWGMHQDSMSSSSSLHVKQGGSVNDFDDIKIERNDHHHHHHHQNLNFEPDDHELVHQSEEAMLKMDNVILKEDNDQIQQAQDQVLKGAVATLFAFPNCDTLD